MKKLDSINLDKSTIIITVDLNTLVPIILNKQMCRFLFDTDDVTEVSKLLKATARSKAFKDFVASENDIGFQI